MTETLLSLGAGLAPAAILGVPIGNKRIPKNAVERFASSFKVDPETKCWVWTSWVRGVPAYGGFSCEGMLWRAHRFSWYLFKDAIPPKGIDLHHVCENKLCVNPAHLQPLPHRRHMLETTNTPPAVNASATHCKSGHELSGENLYIDPATGRRACRECKRLWEKAKRDSQISVLPLEPARMACEKGLHPWVPENQYTNSVTGQKGCILCRREYQRNYQRQYREDGVKRGTQHKTHCKQGHEFTPENTRMSNGRRHCVACTRAAGAKYRARLNAALIQ